MPSRMMYNFHQMQISLSNLMNKELLMLFIYIDCVSRDKWRASVNLQ